MRPLIILILLAGCSSKPIPPEITAVDAPMTAAPGEKIQLGVHFQDPDDAVNVIKIAYPSTMQVVSTPFDPPLFTGAVIHVNVTFPPATPAGPFEIDVSVIDQSALESAVKQVMVTIQ